MGSHDITLANRLCGTVSKQRLWQKGTRISQNNFPNSYVLKQNLGIMFFFTAVSSLTALKQWVEKADFGTSGEGPEISQRKKSVSPASLVYALRE